MKTVYYEKKGNVAYIRLNRPDQRNALNRQMARDLGNIWQDFQNDDTLWVAVLSAEGTSFCAGADVKEMERGRWRFRDSLLLGDESALPRAHKVYKPLISAVQGHAYGAGLILMLESDLRIVAEDAKLGIPEGFVNVPFLFAPFIFDYIPRSIACEMIFTAQPIKAHQAKELGIVNRVVPNADLIDAAAKMAAMVCRLGPLSNFAAKELYNRCRGLDYQSSLALVEHVATPVWNSEDSKEGKKAFMEKREPRWRLH